MRWLDKLSSGKTLHYATCVWHRWSMRAMRCKRREWSDTTQRGHWFRYLYFKIIAFRIQLFLCPFYSTVPLSAILWKSLFVRFMSYCNAMWYKLSTYFPMDSKQRSLCDIKYACDANKIVKLEIWISSCRFCSTDLHVFVEPYWTLKYLQIVIDHRSISSFQW